MMKCVPEDSWIALQASQLVSQFLQPSTKCNIMLKNSPTMIPNIINLMVITIGTCLKKPSNPCSAELFGCCSPDSMSPSLGGSSRGRSKESYQRE